MSQQSVVHLRPLSRRPTSRGEVKGFEVVLMPLVLVVQMEVVVALLKAVVRAPVVVAVISEVEWLLSEMQGVKVPAMVPTAAADTDGPNSLPLFESRLRLVIRRDATVSEVPLSLTLLLLAPSMDAVVSVTTASVTFDIAFLRVRVRRS